MVVSLGATGAFAIALKSDALGLLTRTSSARSLGNTSSFKSFDATVLFILLRPNVIERAI